MRLKQYHSSSSGNLYEVTANNGSRLLIECGVTWSKIQKALNYNLKDIEACFVTHSHKDHCKAIYDVVKAGVTVYTSNETLAFNGLNTHYRANIVEDKTLVRLDTFQVLCFETHHDCAGALGFIVRADNEFLLFATDTSHISQQFKYQFAIVSIECSYDRDILQKRVDTCDINESLAKRLLTSHFEKQNCIKYLTEFCDLSKCREIHLLHMSVDNIDKEQTRKEIEDKFFITTKIKE